MNTLVRCAFCNKTIPFQELELKDKDVGNLCKNCWEWLNNDFLKKWRANNV